MYKASFYVLRIYMKYLNKNTNTIIIKIPKYDTLNSNLFFYEHVFFN